MSQVTHGMSNIKEGIEDQDGHKWLRFGEGSSATWLQAADLHVLDSTQRQALARAGVMLVSRTAVDQFRNSVQQFDGYCRVDVARRPGWSGDTFFLPDGTHLSLKARSDKHLPIFSPDERYSQRAPIQAFQSALAPFIEDQPLVFFAFAFGFVGPLLRFAPPDVQNPLLELVGETHRGKTSLARAVSCIWGSDPSSSIGICESWNFSPNEIDAIRAEKGDGLLVLDEANLAGEDPQKRAKVIGNAAMKLVETGSRRRYGDPVTVDPIRQAVMSTSNAPIADIVGRKTATGRAFASRMLSIECAQENGIFASLPAGYDNARDASQALVAITQRNSGIAGRWFIKRLSQFSSTELQSILEQALVQPITRKLGQLLDDPRHAKIVEMSFVAAHMAVRVGALPRPSSRPAAMFRRLFEAATPITVPAAEAKMRDYLGVHGNSIIADANLLPLSEQAFRQAAGVWWQDRLVVSTTFFQSHVEDAEDVLKELRREGRVDCEAGVLSKKAPRGICKSGRAYFISISHPRKAS